MHGARAVVFGHTHHASGEWEEGRFYGNCGTWAPSFRDVACTIPVEAARPLIWLRTDETGRFEGGLYRWKDGGLSPAEDEAACVEQRPVSRAAPVEYVSPSKEPRDGSRARAS
jgi:hypothetical protein